MQTATVADLRNHFRRVSAYLENGESVDITRRGRVVARLVPAVEKPKKLVKPDIMARLRETYGNRILTTAEVKELRDLELEDHYG
jgi:antitoxin (DNA-binding transcriptional repressor) of toxin-antitoxin stability system